jgi:hypothetical protein
MQHPAFWGQPMSAEQSFNIHNTFPLPIGASRAEPVSHTQYVQLSVPIQRLDRADNQATPCDRYLSVGNQIQRWCHARC